MRIMTKLTAITTPKNATSIRNTLRPVRGLGDCARLMWILRISRRHEMIGGRGDLTEPDIGDTEMHWNGLRGIVLRRRRHQKPQFGGRVTRQDNHRPVLRYGIGPDDMKCGV